MAREIPLTRGFVALVDDEDFEFASRWKWYAAATGPSRRYNYACRGVWAPESRARRTVLLHRELMGNPVGLVVDHINGDTLDNRRCNLRACTHAENLRNKVSNVGAHPFKGVFHHHRAWYAKLKKGGEVFISKAQRSIEDAARAYDELALQHHGEFARLNFPKPEVI